VETKEKKSHKHQRPRPGNGSPSKLHNARRMRRLNTHHHKSTRKETAHNTNFEQNKKTKCSHNLYSEMSPQIQRNQTEVETLTGRNESITLTRNLNGSSESTLRWSTIGPAACDRDRDLSHKMRGARTSSVTSTMRAARSSRGGTGDGETGEECAHREFKPAPGGNALDLREESVCFFSSVFVCVCLRAHFRNSNHA